MFGRTRRIGLLLLPLLEACGTGADFGDGADAATYVASGAGDTTPDGGPEDESSRVENPCFRTAGAEAWICNADGVTLTRMKAGEIEKVRCAHGCVALPDGFDDQCRPRDGVLTSTVNGHVMTAQQASWVSYFAWCAVPLLPGARDLRLTAAATVAWWALKEGVLDATEADPIHADPVGFSLCRRNHPIGPLDRCGGRHPAWQVGASGIQAGCCSLSTVEGTAAALFPEWTEQQLLSGAAVEAGYPRGSFEHMGIVGSTDALRASWLLHVTAIGFFHQAPIVTDECIVKSHSWCYGRGWPMSALYAPDRWSSMRSMRDLRAILDVLSP